MTKPRVMLILNPSADMGGAGKNTYSFRAIAEEHCNPTWEGTNHPTHATDLAKKAGEEGYDIVVAIGGDGTVHEVVNGLMQVPVKKRPKLGVVPLGSGNDFAYALGLDIRPDIALKKILTGTSKKIDIGTLEDEHGRKEYWDNSTSMGFGGAVNIYSHSLPIVRGFLMYFVAVIITIIRQYNVLKVKITTDEAEWETETMMISLCNGSREGGGFLTAPTAVVDDGIFNYTLVRKVSRLMMFRLIPEFMKGTHVNFKEIETGTFKKIEIVSDDHLYLHTDGEVYAAFASHVHHLKLEILPGALEVMIPSSKEEIHSH